MAPAAAAGAAAAATAGQGRAGQGRPRHRGSENAPVGRGNGHNLIQRLPGPNVFRSCSVFFSLLSRLGRQGTPRPSLLIHSLQRPQNNLAFGSTFSRLHPPRHGDVIWKKARGYVTGYS